MKLNVKFIAPQVAVVVVLGCLSFYFIDSSFGKLKEMYVSSVVGSAFTSVVTGIDDASLAARQEASLFSQRPGIVDAFKLAHSGDISDENSPESQRAREDIRKLLKTDLKGFQSLGGGKLRLHFHLPNGRSLVRLWRDKQAKRGGKWVDISDDISSFRQTVLDVNRQGVPLGGIELGRGGFAIRGLVPVKSESGESLGSVEVLKNFAPILKGVEDAGISTMLFMNKNLLETATSLRDTSKYPVVNDEYVLVSSTNADKYIPLISRDLLDQGRNEQAILNIGGTALATLPIRDYKGRQVGILVGAVNLENMVQLSRSANISLLACLGAILFVPLAIIYFILRAQVVNPVRQITSKIRDINEDKADMESCMAVRFRDEIGDMCREFNSLLGKLSSMMNDMQVYVDVVNAVPDPVFVVDKDFHTILANKAVADFAGLNIDEVKARRCSAIFKTRVCSTGKCPIEMAMRSGKKELTEIISVHDRAGNEIFIQPVAMPLRDSEGRIVGYLEVARNVSELVLKENSINEQLERINEVNSSTRAVSADVYNSSEDLDREMSAVDDAVSSQKRLIEETVSAFGQMNDSVVDIAENAGRASEKTLETREKAEDGAKIVFEAAEAITSVSRQTEVMSEIMGKMEGQADSIGRVLSVINDIADQTNLLALNAAIEAARAGEAGRGFAVVADEVRKLAEKTMEATREVEEVITGIQTQTKSSRELTDETRTLAAKAAEFAEKSGSSLKDIVGLVQESSADMGNIAAAVEQQSASSEEINRAMKDVHELAVKVSERVDASSDSLKNLVRLAGRLDEIAAG
ncbi:methyl-accepting chemotaxis protein [Maridesulfovibrio sp.]|uniref:methyl-accepting chemotaxis protein n=1 Tax=Maridesulfovibrio sp. TaxID=2795000 RepID=UPI002A186B8D|nr:methyl-accepting chemotaxis protein [Maridesulfovibrio sp.]